MNREILFRGFHQDESGEDEIVLDRQVIKGYWCFGYYVKNGNKDLIVSTLATSNEVISETVSQYTGKDDKNEHKIFDNDLLKENKQLKGQLQQSEEVIEECKQSINNFMTHIDDGFCADMMTFIDILNKYKKEEN